MNSGIMVVVQTGTKNHKLGDTTNDTVNQTTCMNIDNDNNN